jgi:hypothetical protein
VERRDLVDPESCALDQPLASFLENLARQQSFPELALALFRQRSGRGRSRASRPRFDNGHGGHSGDGAPRRAP